MMKSFTLKSESLMTNNVWNLSETINSAVLMQVGSNTNNTFIGFVPPVPSLPTPRRTAAPQLTHLCQVGWTTWIERIEQPQLQSGPPVP